MKSYRKKKEQKRNELQEYEQKLTGTYHTVYEEMNTYLDSVDSLFDKKEYCQEEILDVLLTAQQQQAPLEKLIGNPKVFCGNLIQSQRTETAYIRIALRGFLVSLIALVIGNVYMLVKKEEYLEFGGISLFYTYGIALGICLLDYLLSELSLKQLLKGSYSRLLKRRKILFLIGCALIGIFMGMVQEYVYEAFPQITFHIKTAAFFLITYTVIIELFVFLVYDTWKEIYHTEITDMESKIRKALMKKYEKKRLKKEKKGKSYSMDAFIEEQKNQTRESYIIFSINCVVCTMVLLWILVCIFLAGTIDWLILTVLWIMLFDLWISQKQRSMLKKHEHLYEELRK